MMLNIRLFRFVLVFICCCSCDKRVLNGSEISRMIQGLVSTDVAVARDAAQALQSLAPALIWTDDQCSSLAWELGRIINKTLIHRASLLASGRVSSTAELKEVVNPSISTCLIIDLASMIPEPVLFHLNMVSDLLKRQVEHFEFAKLNDNEGQKAQQFLQYLNRMVEIHDNYRGRVASGLRR